MPVQQLKDLLDSQGVAYACIEHPPAFTAQELAHHCKIKADQVVKTVIIELDGAMTMLVLPASWRIRWDRLGKILDTDFIDLASEAEFRDCFPNCEVGAMPPFGQLYGMHVYCCETLTGEPELVFAAGNHSESIRMATADFLRLVKPIMISQGFNKPGQARPAWLERGSKRNSAWQEAP